VPPIHPRGLNPPTASLPSPTCPQGYRYAMPHSILMMHHPSGASRGQASDMQIESRELVRRGPGHWAVMACAAGACCATRWAEAKLP